MNRRASLSSSVVVVVFEEVEFWCGFCGSGESAGAVVMGSLWLFAAAIVFGKWREGGVRKRFWRLLAVGVILLEMERNGVNDRI